jgi:exodeoxyribonuclease-3
LQLWCDVNTAHHEIDLAGPTQVEPKTTGFLPEERLELDQVIEARYVDTFRHLHPNRARQYTWWSLVTKARERNVLM